MSGYCPDMKCQCDNYNSTECRNYPLRRQQVEPPNSKTKPINKWPYSNGYASGRNDGFAAGYAQCKVDAERAVEKRLRHYVDCYGIASIGANIIQNDLAAIRELEPKAAPEADGKGGGK